MKISKHFKKSEFFQPGKSGHIDSSDLVKARVLAWYLLEPARRIYQAPIYINSGKRSIDHNQVVQGDPRSEHLWNDDSAAVDIDTQNSEGNSWLFHFLLQNRREAIGQIIAYIDVSDNVRFLHLSLASTRHPVCQPMTATYEYINGRRIYKPYEGGKLSRPE